MTDEERDALLLNLKEGQDRLESGQADIKRDVERIGSDVKRILGTTQGLAAARVESEGRLADHERRLEALERKAG